MERKALITILWLISAWTVTGSVVKGKARITTKPTKSVTGQYRNVPQGVYASAYARAAPYGAFSFNVPVAVPAGKAVEMKRRKIKPAKRDTQNFNGFITDSYGTPVTQSDAYKTAFLQQFLQFHHPTQLQPLAVPSYQSHGLQAPWLWNNAFAQNGQFGKPFVFPGDVKNINSLSEQLQFIAPSNLEQDSSKNKLYYAGQGFNWIHNERENQWADEEAYQNESYYEEPQKYQPPNLMARVQTPIRHTVRTNQYGKDVVVQIETKPPLPLVDLRLLEPLNFPNGIQLQ